MNLKMKLTHIIYYVICAVIILWSLILTNILSSKSLYKIMQSVLTVQLSMFSLRVDSVYHLPSPSRGYQQGNDGATIPTCKVGVVKGYGRVLSTPYGPYPQNPHSCLMFNYSFSFCQFPNEGLVTHQPHHIFLFACLSVWFGVCK